MTLLEQAEFWSYIVTIVGLPFAIVVFLIEQRKERQNEEEEIFQRLSDEYREFLRLVIDNPDLGLIGKRRNGELTAEQNERLMAIYGILVSLFERAYMLVYEETMSKQTLRMWRSWEDYMRDWCQRPDFRAALPSLLEGEDDEFSQAIQKIADESRQTELPHADEAAPPPPH